MSERASPTGSDADRLAWAILEWQKLRCYKGGMTKLESASKLSNAELLAEVKSAAQGERHATARLVALLAEVDTRRLYLGEGCSSLFTYCTQVLHLSEHAAYGRIEAARAARRFPVVLDLLIEGAITLTALTLLAPHLTQATHRNVLTEARHKTKRDVEHIVARLRPQPAVAATVRKLPTPTPAVASPAPLASTADSGDKRPTLPPPRQPATVTPLAPERYKVQFTVSRDTHDKLRRVQDLLRHSIPDGDPAAIFDRALKLLLADLEKTKLAAANRPHTARRTQSGSRHIPAAVRRQVWQRDAGQCAFVGPAGRCTERGFLEFHHVRPYADGGATVVENLELRCRAHNVYEAELYFGSRLPLLVREDGAPPYLMTTRSGPGSLTSEVCHRAEPAIRCLTRGRPAAIRPAEDIGVAFWHDKIAGTYVVTVPRNWPLTQTPGRFSAEEDRSGKCPRSHARGRRR